MIITLQLSMSIATMEEEIVGDSMKLNHAMRQQFPKHRHAYIALNFQWPG